MFIIGNATTQNITVDHLTLEVGMQIEQESISKNMMIAKNKGLITIAVAADLHPGTRVNNPNGEDLVLLPENIDEALGFAPSEGTGTGTVTSVGLTMPAIFSVAGGPITGAGTFAVTLASQVANKFLASPVGSAGAPVMRGIDPTDLPLATTAAFGAVKIGSGLTVTAGVLSLTTAAPTAANPTATAGLAAVNGVAATFMRSDAAPAISQAIVPTWTGKHTFSGGAVIAAAAPTVAAGQVGLGGTTQTTVGTAGGASALPATPTGYIIINVAGTPAVIPYFAAS